ncbi:UDP-N-acetylglucosamine 2-epimerase [Magnetospirillum sp. SS-4]|uniref:UDP-N-acetylglucosamine 2-epimerase n=1 Tax=Magnetospirillum sp. SS-4 TaxID=2681465 RepID=UPI001C2DAE21|nr:UDP-N-acetylglucosamine 2-epimerase [Magnetospirillum sp. SS-4]
MFPGLRPRHARHQSEVPALPFSPTPAPAHRTICVVTGSRAEYGLLLPLMRTIEADSALDLRLVVTGSHLSARFGATAAAIEADGLVIDARVDLELAGDSPRETARAMALGLTGMAEAFERQRPHLVVVLGDRYEILAAAQAAMLLRIPIAHIHGGEASEGAMDEAIRHALTKMAHLHFAAAEPYRRRIVQMGERPERVFTVGAMALDALAALPAMPRAELEQRLGLPEGAPFFLVTYHPVTLENGDPGHAMEALAAALDAFPDHHVIATGVNADPGHDSVSRVIDRWCKARPGRVRAATSLGLSLYAAAMDAAAAVVGNSSSGIIEAPFLKTPTVNIGRRQQGRLRAASVIDCAETEADIRAALIRALAPAFRAEAARAPYPFGTPGAAARIAEALRTVQLDGLLIKTFFDLPGDWA